MSAPTRLPTDTPGRPPAPAIDPVAAPDPRSRDLTRLGGRTFWWAWSAFTTIVAMVDLIDVLTRLHDGRANHVFEPVWRAVTDEFSSGLVEVALFPLIWRLAQAVRPGAGSPVRAWGVHAAAAIVFAAVHVAGFVAIRKAVFAVAGETYIFGGLGPFLYELQKDCLTYAVAVGLIWGSTRLLAGLPSPAAPLAPESTTFDIRDGAKVVRVRIDDILAVRSAGNYVEFLLADGRAPLVRATLAGVEAQLRPHGVARTHRSWLVNTGRIEEIEPARSGDFRLSLKGGIEAPLSRRFRPALKPGNG